MAINDNFLTGSFGGTTQPSNFSTGNFLTAPSTDYLSSLTQSFGDTSSLVDSNLNLGNQGQGQGMFDGFFSNGQGGAGWGTQALGAGMGLAQTFLGFSQLSEGKKQNKLAQQQWQQQFDIQKEEYDRRTSERAERIANNEAAKTRTTGG